MTAGRYGEAASHPLDQLEPELDRLPPRLGAEELRGEVVQVGDRGVVELAHERVTVREVAVHRAGADSGRGREFVERRVDAALGEELLRLDEQPLVVASRIAAGRHG